MMKFKKDTRTISIRLDNFVIKELNNAIKLKNKKIGYTAYSRSKLVGLLIKKWIARVTER